MESIPDLPSAGNGGGGVMIEHPITTQRALNILEEIEGEKVARWLGHYKRNPFSWTDPRHEPAQVEIERQRMIRAARGRKQANG